MTLVVAARNLKEGLLRQMCPQIIPKFLSLFFENRVLFILKKKTVSWQIIKKEVWRPAKMPLCRLKYLIGKRESNPNSTIDFNKNF